jgi:hypothetical protein
MSVLLRQSRDVPWPAAYNAWLAVTGTEASLDSVRKLPDLAGQLEKAFVAERETWWRLGRALSKEPTADAAHMPTAGSFGSDFGIMLAWSRLVAELARADGAPTLVLCDDPWLFRHLTAVAGVDAGQAPSVSVASLRLAFRGLLARCRVAFRAAAAAIGLRGTRRVMRAVDSVILVYGHPASDAAGHDAYFGDLMARFTGLKRLLHTDCDARRARELSADGRTASLHAWGHPLFALGLAGFRWRPAKLNFQEPFGWLVRRAAAVENGGGGPAMNLWQRHCQERWLRATHPARVLWPWENHGWERNLCRAGRHHGITLIGYQHTVIGPHQFNYATATNHDGTASIPDIVVANGPAYHDEMLAWGVPAERLVIGGAFRFPHFAEGLFDPEGPIFVPLSAVTAVARAQLNVARALSHRGRRVLVKPHPMYPIAFEANGNLEATDRPLVEQAALSAVLYGTGTSGLEATLMGLPAYRLMADDRIAIDVLPAGVTAAAVTLEDAVEVIFEGRTPNRRIRREDIFGEPDMELWKKLLFGDIKSAATMTDKTKQAS